MNIPSLQFVWHCHHHVLVEPLTRPLEVRKESIRRSKHPDEVPLRLRLIRLVSGQLPSPVIETGVAYEKARAVCEKARAVYKKEWAALDKAVTAYEEAWAAYDEAVAGNLPAIMALHAAECEPDCPWDGHTIFP